VRKGRKKSSCGKIFKAGNEGRGWIREKRTVIQKEGSHFILFVEKLKYIFFFSFF